VQHPRLAFALLSGRGRPNQIEPFWVVVAVVVVLGVVLGVFVVVVIVAAVFVVVVVVVFVDFVDTTGRRCQDTVQILISVRKSWSPCSNPIFGPPHWDTPTGRD